MQQSVQSAPCEHRQLVHAERIHYESDSAGLITRRVKSPLKKQQFFKKSSSRNMIQCVICNKQMLI